MKRRDWFVGADVALVSIPKRASAKVKQINQVQRLYDKWVSIPKRASAKVKQVGDEGRSGWYLFQSLKGHQPKWNLNECDDCVVGFPDVSIPKRASAKVKRAIVASPVQAIYTFQSLKGHQPKWNSRVIGPSCNLDKFQSLKGHQPKWNHVHPSAIYQGFGFNP